MNENEKDKIRIKSKHTAPFSHAVLFGKKNGFKEQSEIK